jgi:hypothetical protein
MHFIFELVKELIQLYSSSMSKLQEFELIRLALVKLKKSATISHRVEI